MRLAYLINQYPKISHSFIRREILALEQLMGFEIMRISLRGWDLELVDDQDRAERARTRYVLQTPVPILLLGVARMLLHRPGRLLRAFAKAWHMSRASVRPLHVHLAYVVEACLIEHWLREAGIEHLHAHFGTNSAEVAMLVHLLGGPSWSFTVHGPEEYAYVRALHLREKIIDSTFTVAISSFGQSQLFYAIERHYWPKIHVVHCGLDATFASEPPVVEALPKQLVCVARLSPEKAHGVLLNAALLLTKQGIDFKIVLVGDGELRCEIEAEIAKHNLVDKIRLTGSLAAEQVRNEILASRALVLQSFAEGLPVVIMEAMALRRPVIATFVGGIPELVRMGQDGWLVPPGDPVALAEAMRECLDSPVDVIAHMGRAARERVLLRHSVDTEAAKMQKLFHRAVVELPCS